MILVGLINLANNIRDLEGDKVHGRKTLAVLFGKRNAVIFMAVMFVFSYLWAFTLIGLGIISPWILLIVLSIPKPIKAIKEFFRNSTPPQMMPAMKAASQTNTIFGALLSLGIFIGYLL
jgi:1,4-dihydroxy-2-naphthoate octaprenyltransferase